MSRFKNIEKLVIDLLYAYQCDKKSTVINAEDLERILQSAQVVYGHVKQGKPNYWGPRENGQFDDTHTALIVGITPIKKKTKAEAALESLGKLANDPAYYSSLGAAEAKKILEMKQIKSYKKEKI